MRLGIKVGPANWRQKLEAGRRARGKIAGDQADDAEQSCRDTRDEGREPRCADEIDEIGGDCGADGGTDGEADRAPDDGPAPTTSSPGRPRPAASSSSATTMTAWCRLSSRLSNFFRNPSSPSSFSGDSGTKQKLTSLLASVAAAAIAVLKGADIVRAHDVAQTVDAVAIARAVVLKPAILLGLVLAGVPAAAQDIIASMQPYHAIDDGRWAERVIGPERARTTYAFRSLIDSGARVAFGSDWYVAPASPILGIHAAVTRQ
mgnify:CR=1 FL=1